MYPAFWFIFARLQAGEKAEKSAVPSFGPYPFRPEQAGDIHAGVMAAARLPDQDRIIDPLQHRDVVRRITNCNGGDFAVFLPEKPDEKRHRLTLVAVAKQVKKPAAGEAEPLGPDRLLKLDGFGFAAVEEKRLVEIPLLCQPRLVMGQHGEFRHIGNGHVAETGDPEAFVSQFPNGAPNGRIWRAEPDCQTIIFSDNHNIPGKNSRIEIPGGDYDTATVLGDEGMTVPQFPAAALDLIPRLAGAEDNRDIHLADKPQGRQGRLEGVCCAVQESTVQVCEDNRLSHVMKPLLAPSGRGLNLHLLAELVPDPEAFI